MSDPLDRPAIRAFVESFSSAWGLDHPNGCTRDLADRLAGLLAKTAREHDDALREALARTRGQWEEVARALEATMHHTAAERDTARTAARTMLAELAVRADERDAAEARCVALAELAERYGAPASERDGALRAGTRLPTSAPPRAPSPPSERSAPQGPEPPAAPPDPDACPGADPASRAAPSCTVATPCERCAPRPEALVRGPALATVAGRLTEVGGRVRIEAVVLTADGRDVRLPVTRDVAQALASHLYERVIVDVRLASEGS